MKVIHTEIEINAPASRVWEILTDFGSFPQWNPFIRQVSGEPKDRCSIGNETSLLRLKDHDLPVNGSAIRAES